MRNYTYFTLTSICIFGLLAQGCGNSTQQSDQGPEHEVELMLVDSIMVDKLEPLVIDDYRSDLGYFLFRETKSRKPILTDEKGTILKEFDILNEGPDGMGSYGTGYRLMDEQQWVAQNLMTGFFTYDYQGHQLGKFAPETAGLFSISVFSGRTKFTPIKKNGDWHLLAEEPNVFDHKAIDAEQLGAVFYDQAKSLIDMNLSSGEQKLLTSYPDGWEPKVSQRYIGNAFPLLAINQHSLKMGVLPTAGNQLFIFDYSGEEPILRDTVMLSHRHRPEQAPKAASSEDRWQDDYPVFTDLRVWKDGFLVGFHTRIPAEVMKSLRAKSEEYYKLPEFKEASKQYAKPYYIVIRDGKQFGVINKLPIDGNVDFMDEEGFIYINNNSSPEIERDYNVFYKLQIKN